MVKALLSVLLPRVFLFVLLFLSLLLLIPPSSSPSPLSYLHPSVNVSFFIVRPQMT